ncbi:MAG: ATP synthase subunit b [Parcubacteria group bacterium GW2011_GWA2_47_7]|nr:MAG: ATP synthase subunit b [Parcubacteria group bacterium GW2011_GWA2_47_7]
MEIFHAFGIEWKLLLIQVINFSIALFVLRRYAYKPIIAILAKREKELAEGVAAAEDAKKERGAISDEKETILRGAREDGGKIVDQLRKEATEKELFIMREAQEKSAVMIAEAKSKAEEERLYILRESEKEIARIAVLATEKILLAKTHGG